MVTIASFCKSMSHTSIAGVPRTSYVTFAEAENGCNPHSAAPAGAMPIKWHPSHTAKGHEQRSGATFTLSRQRSAWSLPEEMHG